MLDQGVLRIGQTVFDQFAQVNPQLESWINNRLSIAGATFLGQIQVCDPNILKGLRVCYTVFAVEKKGNLLFVEGLPATIIYQDDVTATHHIAKKGWDENFSPIVFPDQFGWNGAWMHWLNNL